MQEIVDIEEDETIRNIYDTNTLKEIESEVNQKRYQISYNGGENCGREGTGETIYINDLALPETLVLGENATFSAEVKVNKIRKTATLLSVVMQKVGFPFDIPCTHNVGTCKYSNPCDMLEKIKCPKEIIKLGWNCRCPIPINTYSFGPVTVTLPTVPLPAFLVDGKYEVKAQLFDGDDELLCYDLQIDVTED